MLSIARRALESVARLPKVVLIGIGLFLIGLLALVSYHYQHPLTVCYIDVDDLKAINDRQSYAAGDDVLRLVASTIRKNLRATDSVARLGGDEFMVLLQEAWAPESVDQMVQMADELMYSAKQKGKNTLTGRTIR